ncbi:filamentous hemagglutinin outer membrane protein [Scytonema sp. HK-05]|uniref:hypothetical protein n=1 Tax=Scytonema sp. HK-05 TaxID=1137095 RepID=UPI0009362F9B|nr:hypothetical protein [Scytonema sp. HK-05]OKH58973.1 hypothetical protein NIES2130_11715 [Scytonema sp. HK-05]BAY47062.1 filamentous hemagglutinin outer membrane protein [Scytonema sp. HK-05]
MSQSRSGQYWKLGLASAFTIGAVLALYGDYALAQIRSDGTPVAESSAVKSNPNNDRPSNEVNGRANCTANLFRRVEHFSTSTDVTDHRNNTADINNINEVTAKSISDIGSTFRVNGTTNLFLLNSIRKPPSSDAIENQQLKDHLRQAIQYHKPIKVACCMCGPSCCPPGYC